MVCALPTLLVSALFAVCSANTNVHAFYYLWYGNPATDGAYMHWNHEVLPWWKHADRFPHGMAFQPPHELHSPFYPERGCYSSADLDTVTSHFQDMVDHGIGVAVVSWWGRPTVASTHDTQGVNTDSRIPTVLQAAEATGIKIAWHLEPYAGRDAASVQLDVEYIHEKYGRHPSLLRWVPRRRRAGHPGAPQPVFYVYDSYHVAPSAWMTMLSPTAPRPVRGTSGKDGFFIGLWLESQHGRDLFSGGFDGFYSYFAAQTSFGSSTSNWGALQSFAKDKGHDMLFVPCVAPGYQDDKIRPWNRPSSRDRGDGRYYDAMWEAALATKPEVVAITSYNEWGEGTQIEAAVPHTVPKGKGFTAAVRETLGISPQSAAYPSTAFYMERTAAWSDRLKEGSSHTEL